MRHKVSDSNVFRLLAGPSGWERTDMRFVSGGFYRSSLASPASDERVSDDFRTEEPKYRSLSLELTRSTLLHSRLMSATSLSCDPPIRP